MVVLSVSFYILLRRLKVCPSSGPIESGVVSVEWAEMGAGPAKVDSVVREELGVRRFCRPGVQARVEAAVEVATAGPAAVYCDWLSQHEGIAED